MTAVFFSGVMILHYTVLLIQDIDLVFLGFQTKSWPVRKTKPFSGLTSHFIEFWKM